MAVIVALVALLLTFGHAEDQQCPDCSDQPVLVICGRNRYGFMSNFDNECVMQLRNCRHNTTYLKYKDGNCWDDLFGEDPR